MSDPLFPVPNKLPPPLFLKLKPEVHLLSLDISKEKGVKYSLGQKKQVSEIEKLFQISFLG